jgi:hypothetical protein
MNYEFYVIVVRVRHWHDSLGREAVMIYIHDLPQIDFFSPSANCGPLNTGEISGIALVIVI